MTDQFLYLEEINSKKSLDWVQKENTLTSEKLTQNQFFKETYVGLEKVLFEAQALPYISKIGAYVYNFWQDHINVLGVWRRALLENYQKEDIQWETLIDFDQLSADEGVKWFFGGVERLEIDDQYCLVYLSENGADSVQIREFNLAERNFVDGGFFIESAKTQVRWISQNEIYVMTDFGDGSLTLSGYPKIVKRWKRDTPLNEAKTVFEVFDQDLSAFAFLDHCKGYERHVFTRIINFYESEYFVGEEQFKLNVPKDARVSFYRNLMLIELKSHWDISAGYLAGSLMCIDFDAFKNGDREFDVIFKSSTCKTLSNYTFTQDFLILDIMKDVSNYLEVYDIQSGIKLVDAIYPDEAYSQITIDSVENFNNDVLISIQSFINPPTQYFVELESMKKQKLKSKAHSIDQSHYRVAQHFALSKDGTKVPYFQISLEQSQLNHLPVLIEGYGGFEVSLTPRFLEKEIESLISKGVVYVIANIRGGNEYGPDWHQQALKHNRHKSYEDFSAVAQHLIDRGVTIKEKLAAIGGSNGGLLMGNMLMQYPDLFSAIVCEVPLLDMLRFTQIGAGYSWIAEYGDPLDSQDAKYLKTISPYHLLDEYFESTAKLPAVLFYTTTTDDRVTPAHARKMAAKMKSMNIPNVYFYEQVDGGHSIFANKKLSAFHSALVSSFLFEVGFR